MTRFPPIDVRHPVAGDIVTDQVNVAGFLNIGDSVAIISIRAEDDSELASTTVRSLDFGSGDFGVTLEVTPTTQTGNVVVSYSPDSGLEAAVVPVTFGSTLFSGGYLGFFVHTVEPGDTLFDIAAANYGDGNRWPLLALVNRDIVADPNLIHPGQELRIPVDPANI
ncbi:MAG TPA: LysM peptidoglycan-binding domain-containing protein [Acidimicrobiales bacterium]|nr:LysM peptidoglycan-binding domain-containing protein [Acidimicrobiales bacterium]